jgi:hypothetical protein
MRSGAWLCAGAALLFGLLGGCAGDYPLPPTPCDDWCNASQGGWSYCGGFYNPAACVSECEANQSASDRCRPFLDAAISCYRHTPNVLAEQCTYDPQIPRPCQTEVEALGICVSASYQDLPQR